MAKFIINTVLRLVTRLNNAFRGKANNQRSVSDDMIVPAPRFMGVHETQRALPAVIEPPVEAVIEIPAVVPAPAAEPLQVEPSECEVLVDEPVEKQEPVSDAGPTVLTRRASAVQQSRFRCGTCHVTASGLDMVASKINSWQPIPTDEEIVASSLCRSCGTDPAWGWLAGVIKYAAQARTNKLERCKQLMSSTMHGDESKSPACRSRYLETNNQEARGKMAWDIFNRFMEGCSTRSLFETDEKAAALLNLAVLWSTASEIGRRASIIERRITAGKFDRARNTLGAARQEFPSGEPFWERLTALLMQAEQRAKQEELVAGLRTQIEQAVQNDDVDTLAVLIARGTEIAPQLNWEEIAVQSM